MFYLNYTIKDFQPNVIENRKYILRPLVSSQVFFMSFTNYETAVSLFFSCTCHTLLFHTCRPLFMDHEDVFTLFEQTLSKHYLICFGLCWTVWAVKTYFRVDLRFVRSMNTECCRPIHWLDSTCLAIRQQCRRRLHFLCLNSVKSWSLSLKA